VTARRSTRVRLLAACFAAIAILAGAPAAAAPPRISARTAFLVQPDTRDVVFARAPGRRRPMASTAKLMTALLTLEHAKLSQVIAASPYAAAPGESVVGLRAGERLTVADLLRALLLPSANDAAVTLSIGVSHSESAFVALMNRRARQLGLNDTHYANPIGLDDPGEYSSARDLVELALVLRRNPFFRATVDRPRAVLKSGSHQRLVVNRNDLVGRVPYVDGVKSGHTNTAGYVLVGSARRGGVTVASAVMGEPSLSARDSDTLALLRYALGRYAMQTPVRARARMTTVAIADQDGGVPLLAARAAKVVARRGERLKVRLTGVPDHVTGPVAAGARVGTAEVLRRGRVAARVPLVTARPVAKATVGQRVRGWLGSTATIVLLVALVACTVQLLLLRRRVVRRRRRSAGEPEAT
jgi:serine-type D-Ala-D-Ala carboxypeptidase (penicillin-binding protein 5/6)